VVPAEVRRSPQAATRTGFPPVLNEVLTMVEAAAAEATTGTLARLVALRVWA
jgi:hypothetical protein